MKLRWPLMLRSTHAAAIDAQLRRHHVLAGDLHDKLNRASAERKALENEIVRLNDRIRHLESHRDEWRRIAHDRGAYLSHLVGDPVAPVSWWPEPEVTIIIVPTLTGVAASAR